MYLILDTETSGLPLFNAPANDPNQAHIVQLACILLDESFEEKACFNALIKPQLFHTIHPKAQEAHGISIEDCHKYGMPIKDALSVFIGMFYKATTRVAHNIKFDRQLYEIDHKLAFDAHPIAYEQASLFCTMNATTPICKLPKKNNWGAGSYKWPRLEEAYLHIFNEPMINAHDALADVRACARIFKWLMSNEHAQTSVQDSAPMS